MHMFFSSLEYYNYSFALLSGELAELKADLQSDRKDRKKEAIKKIIASMTVGKDVRCVCMWRAHLGLWYPCLRWFKLVFFVCEQATLCVGHSCMWKLCGRPIGSLHH